MNFICYWYFSTINPLLLIHATIMGSATPRDEFKRVLNTLRENKIMVDTREDGIYIRMAGTESKGECFTYEWAKVKYF